MKNRHLIIIIIGLLLTFVTYQSKYINNIFISIIWFVLLLTGILIFLITLYRNISRYRKEKIFNFFTTYLILAFFIILCAFEYKIQSDFNKTSLIKVFYDGDFNSSAIDFKEDGSYIFDNSAIGMSDYTYGDYTISGHIITLDKPQIENVIISNKLEIRAQKTTLPNTNNEKYLYQIDKKGNVIDGEIVFRIIVDNRKISSTHKSVN